ncbi:CPCC family cysteine-rich protein [Orbaceae bacterium ESL0721]|nr:CPCC family cysteine-rich protein [Orbaceae bacterium ESL0721]
MIHSKFYLALLLKNILKCAFALVLASVSALYFMIRIYYGDDFPWTTIFGYSDLKKLITGSILAGTGGWVMFILNFHRSTKLGIKALKALRKNGYKAKINEISPNPKISLYKIDGELFYNFAPSTMSRGYVLENLSKIIKRAEPKNIVVNLSGVSKIDINKLKKRILKKFDGKINKILIIDKQGGINNLDQDSDLLPCPCCGNYVFHKEGKGEICPICGWIDDLLQSIDPDYKNGWNKISLNQAKAEFKQKDK